ncbi:hypothetical protein XENOCAPTIV_000511, partial [Xenoophorus captivus]
MNGSQRTEEVTQGHCLRPPQKMGHEGGMEPVYPDVATPDAYDQVWRPGTPPRSTVSKLREAAANGCTTCGRLPFWGQGNKPKPCPQVQTHVPTPIVTGMFLPVDQSWFEFVGYNHEPPAADLSISKDNPSLPHQQFQVLVCTHRSWTRYDLTASVKEAPGTGNKERLLLQLLHLEITGWICGFVT